MTQPVFVTLLERYIQEGGFAGAALVAAQHGKLIVEHYAGEAAPGLAAGQKVLWPVASISKLYTAALIMRLVEQGKLTLNTPVHQVLPQFTGEDRDVIRLRHLLTHTSGLIYESPEMEQRLIDQVSMAALIEEAYSAPLIFKPGTSISYADYNYLLAAHMAEVVTGQSFAELVLQEVLQPMGLHETFMPPPPSEYTRIAKVRGVMGEGTAGAMYNSPHALSLGHPAFGTVASARDLLRFALHFAPDGPRIHAAATIRAMTVDQTGGTIGRPISLGGTSPETRVPWGFGFALQTARVPCLFSDLASHRTYGHGGASGCQLVIDPEAGAVIALMSNSHARTGRDRWGARLQSIINSVFASLG